MSARLKLLAALPVALAIGAAGAAITGCRGGRAGLAAALLVAAALLAALAAVPGIGVPIATGLPARGLTGVAAPLCAAVVLAVELGARPVRLVAIAAAAALLWAFALVANDLFQRQALVQAHDLALASRLLARIEADSDYRPEQTHRLAVIGRLPSLGRAQNSVGRSAFDAPWSQRTIFRLHGVWFDRAARDDAAAVAAIIARGAAWPAPGGVEVTPDGLVVIVLEPPR